jgi:hypothetical protein
VQGVPIFENLYWQLETDVITNFIFEISSCVLSCFLGFSAKSLLRFHFILQKTIKTESFKRSWDDGSGKWDKHTGSEGKWEVL